MAKVYVSSTKIDLDRQRKATIEWLTANGHLAVDSYSADSETVHISCLGDVDRCDLYVGIFGHRYGHIPTDDNPDGLSITELEFRRARRDRRVALIQMNVDSVDLTDIDKPAYKRVHALRELVRQQARAAEFRNDTELIIALSTAVPKILKEIQQVEEILFKLREAEENNRQKDVALAAKDRALAQKERELAEKDRHIAELKRDAVRRVVSEAGQSNPLPGAEAAVGALAAGDPRPAQELLLQKEIATRSPDHTVPEPDARRRQAAQLARDQGALAMSHDSRVALSAYLRATEQDPEHVWTWFAIGDLYKVIGNLGEAMLAYRRGLALADSGERFRDLCVGELKIGDVNLSRGHSTAALKAFRRALVIAERMLQKTPDHLEFQRDAALTYGKIADVLRRKGDWEGAVRACRRDLEISDAIAGRSPGNVQANQDVAISLQNLAELLKMTGNHSEAKDTIARASVIADAHFADARDPEGRRVLSVNLAQNGDALSHDGDLATALEIHRKDLAIIRELTSRDPANTEWLRDLSISHERVGDVLMDHGDHSRALLEYNKALEISHRLTEIDRTNMDWQRDLAVTLEKIGDVHSELRQFPEARQAYLRDLAIMELLCQVDPGNVNWQADLAISCANLGTLRHGQTVEQRRAYLHRGRTILRRLRARRLLHPSQDWIAYFDHVIRHLR